MPKAHPTANLRTRSAVHLLVSLGLSVSTKGVGKVRGFVIYTPPRSY
jgi:hypothetical protein